MGNSCGISHQPAATQFLGPAKAQLLPSSLVLNDGYEVAERDHKAQKSYSGIPSHGSLQTLPTLSAVKSARDKGQVHAIDPMNLYYALKKQEASQRNPKNLSLATGNKGMDYIAKEFTSSSYLSLAQQPDQVEEEMTKRRWFSDKKGQSLEDLKSSLDSAKSKPNSGKQRVGLPPTPPACSSMVLETPVKELLAKYSNRSNTAETPKITIEKKEENSPQDAAWKMNVRKVDLREIEKIQSQEFNNTSGRECSSIGGDSNSQRFERTDNKAMMTFGSSTIKALKDQLLTKKTQEIENVSKKIDFEGSTPMQNTLMSSFNKDQTQENYCLDFETYGELRMENTQKVEIINEDKFLPRENSTNIMDLSHSQDDMLGTLDFYQNTNNLAAKLAESHYKESVYENFDLSDENFSEEETIPQSEREAKDSLAGEGIGPEPNDFKTPELSYDQFASHRSQDLLMYSASHKKNIPERKEEEVVEEEKSVKEEEAPKKYQPTMKCFTDGDYSYEDLSNEDYYYSGAQCLTEEIAVSGKEDRDIMESVAKRRNISKEEPSPVQRNQRLAIGLRKKPDSLNTSKSENKEEEKTKRGSLMDRLMEKLLEKNEDDIAAESVVTPAGAFKSQAQYQSQSQQQQPSQNEDIDTERFYKEGDDCSNNNGASKKIVAISVADIECNSHVIKEEVSLEATLSESHRHESQVMKRNSVVENLENKPSAMLSVSNLLKVQSRDSSCLNRSMNNDIKAESGLGTLTNEFLQNELRANGAEMNNKLGKMKNLHVELFEKVGAMIARVESVLPAQEISELMGIREKLQILKEMSCDFNRTENTLQELVNSTVVHEDFNVQIQTPTLGETKTTITNLKQSECNLSLISNLDPPIATAPANVFTLNEIDLPVSKPNQFQTQLGPINIHQVMAAAKGNNMPKVSNFSSKVETYESEKDLWTQPKQITMNISSLLVQPQISMLMPMKEDPSRYYPSPQKAPTYHMMPKHNNYQAEELPVAVNNSKLSDTYAFSSSYFNTEQPEERIPTADLQPYNPNELIVKEIYQQQPSPLNHYGSGTKFPQYLGQQRYSAIPRRNTSASKSPLKSREDSTSRSPMRVNKSMNMKEASTSRKPSKVMHPLPNSKANYHYVSLIRSNSSERKRGTSSEKKEAPPKGQMQRSASKGNFIKPKAMAAEAIDISRRCTTDFKEVPRPQNNQNQIPQRNFSNQSLNLKVNQSVDLAQLKKNDVKRYEDLPLKVQEGDSTLRADLLQQELMKIDQKLAAKRGGSLQRAGVSEPIYMEDPSPINMGNGVNACLYWVPTTYADKQKKKEVVPGKKGGNIQKTTTKMKRSATPTKEPAVNKSMPRIMVTEPGSKDLSMIYEDNDYNFQLRAQIMKRLNASDFDENTPSRLSGSFLSTSQDHNNSRQSFSRMSQEKYWMQSNKKKVFNMPGDSPILS